MTSLMIACLLVLTLQYSECFKWTEESKIQGGNSKVEACPGNTVELPFTFTLDGNEIIQDLTVFISQKKDLSGKWDCVPSNPSVSVCREYTSVPIHADQLGRITWGSINGGKLTITNVLREFFGFYYWGFITLKNDEMKGAGPVLLSNRC